MIWLYAPYSPTCWPYSAILMATILRNRGHGVRIVQSPELVQASSGDVVCLSMVYSAYVDDYDKIARTTPARLVVGGDCAVGYGREYWVRRWQRPDVCLVEGYGENAVLPAVACPSMQHVRCGPTLDDWPAPDFSLFDISGFDIGAEKQTEMLWGRVAKGISYESWRKPFGIVYASRGCWLGCSFCDTVPMYGPRIHAMSLTRLREELIAQRDQGVRWFAFFDPDFGASRARLEATCRALIEWDLGLWWNCEGIGQSWREPTLRLMKDAGCFYVRFGLESAAASVRMEYNKARISLDKIATAVSHARQVGLPTHFNLILGAKCETDETVQATIEYMNRTGVDYYQVSVLASYVGSPLFSQVGCERLDPWRHGADRLRRWRGMLFDRARATFEGDKDKDALPGEDVRNVP